MTCDYCTRAPAGACVGEAFCASLHLSDEDACELAATSASPGGRREMKRSNWMICFGRCQSNE